MLSAHVLVEGVEPSPLWRGCTFRGWCIHRRTRANARTLRCMSRRLSDQTCYIFQSSICVTTTNNHGDDTVFVHLPSSTLITAVFLVWVQAGSWEDDMWESAAFACVCYMRRVDGGTHGIPAYRQWLHLCAPPSRTTRRKVACTAHSLPGKRIASGQEQYRRPASALA